MVRSRRLDLVALLAVLESVGPLDAEWLGALDLSLVNRDPQQRSYLFPDQRQPDDVFIILVTAALLLSSGSIVSALRDLLVVLPSVDVKLLVQSAATFSRQLSVLLILIDIAEFRPASHTLAHEVVGDVAWVAEAQREETRH